MRRFLYYFAGIPGVNAEMLATRGALSRFTGIKGDLITHCVNATGDGPAGSGCIVAAGTHPAAYAPGVQRWERGEAFWVGVEDVERVPGPDDLARDIGISGYPLPLANQDWRIPLLRRWDLSTLSHISNLPKSLRSRWVDGKRQAYVGISPEFEKLDAMADKIFGNFMEGKTLTLDEAFQDCIELLAVNYRIGIEEASLLGMVDTEAALKILGLAIDLPKLQSSAIDFSTDGLQPHEPVIAGEE